MPEPARDENAGMSSFMRTALQSVGIFIFIQFVMKQFIAPQPAAQNASAAGVAKPGAVPEFSARPVQMDPDAVYNAIPQQIAPMWQDGVPLDLCVYVSPSVAMPALNKVPPQYKVIDEKNFGFGDWTENRAVDTEFPVPTEVQRNGTLFAHFYVAQSGNPLDPTAPNYDSSKAYHSIHPLTQSLAKKKARKVHNLLAGKEEEEEAGSELVHAGPEYASYYHPNFTLSFVPGSGTINFPTMHPGPRSFVQLERTGARDATGQNGWYYPILYVNTFWQLRDHMTELNETVETLPLHVSVNNFANWKFSVIASIDANVKSTQANAAAGQMSAGGDGSEFEQLKSVLLDTNSYLLATTAVVSVLHMIFEMLAFKSDVSHWRNKKDNVGTSVRTILANVLMQSIIFLYLMDNNENTSWMILFGQGMGIVIEAWKITKTVNVRVRPTPEGSLLPYTITFEDKHILSETEKKTQEYDQIAFKYLYYVAIPLLLAYAIYSLIYESHKSWYSFIITTLVGSVYAYGFLMMVPSLYINYRLKSVAHMPARAMMYKFLNTFIDDLFAFTIKMPTLHRLATLRDDVIFFIYLYQAWKYKVDYTRVNEFGQGGEDEEVEEKKANEPLKAIAEANTENGEAEKVLGEREARATGVEKGQGKKRKSKK